MRYRMDRQNGRFMKPRETGIASIGEFNSPMRRIEKAHGGTFSVTCQGKERASDGAGKGVSLPRRERGPRAAFSKPLERFFSRTEVLRTPKKNDEIAVGGCQGFADEYPAISWKRYTGGGALTFAKKLPIGRYGARHFDPSVRVTREATLRTFVDRGVFGPGPAAEGRELIVAKRGLDFVLVVHHEGPVLRDRLTDGTGL